MNYNSYVNPDVQFNAGLSIAQEIDSYFKASSQSKFNDDFSTAHFWLTRAEIRMFPKIRDSDEAEKELKEIKTKVEPYLEIYKRKRLKNKKIGNKVMVPLKNYLDEYEEVLSFWRDKFGYGMPTKKSLLTPSKW